MGERVICYIDGFNFFYGLKSKSWKKYYWLNVGKLAEELNRDSKDVQCKYFTAKVTGGATQHRQNQYLQALESLLNVEVVYGRYSMREKTCQICKKTYKSPEEKMTDVNIAVTMVSDAYNNRFDRALLISGDTDLIPPIKEVVALGKTVRVGFPPGKNRHNSQSLKAVATGNFVVGETNIKKSLLPDPIVVNGYPIRKPHSWV